MQDLIEILLTTVSGNPSKEDSLNTHKANCTQDYKEAILSKEESNKQTKTFLKRVNIYMYR